MCLVSITVIIKYEAFLFAGVTATLSSTLFLYMLIAMFKVHSDIVALENKPDMSD